MNNICFRCIMPILAIALSRQADADVLIANDVPFGTTQIVSTVRPKTTFHLAGAVFTGGICNGFGVALSRQRILRSGQPVTGFISTGITASVQIEFNPPILFRGGTTIEAQNGDSACASSFTLLGETVRR